MFKNFGGRVNSVSAYMLSQNLDEFDLNIVVQGTPFRVYSNNRNRNFLSLFLELGGVLFTFSIDRRTWVI